MIVVGFDMSDQARDALALGRMLSDAVGARLVVASAFPWAPPGEYPRSYEEAASEHFEEAKARASQEMGETEFEWREVADVATHGLIALAGEEAADMIVVGSTHRGPVGRILPGSVGERLLHGAPCSVAIAPKGLAGSELGPIAKVAVGYDATQESAIALSEGIGIARRAGARLEVITVVPSQDGKSPGQRDRLHGQLLDAVSGARHDGLDVDGILSEKDTAIGLASRGSEADLLILGSRGHGPVASVLLGSTSARVIRSASVPILVVPRGAQERAQEHAGEAAQ